MGGSSEMVYQIEEIKSRLYPIFKAAPVYKVFLFGSYANGTATEKSDIDLVIDSRNELHGLRFYALLDDVVSALDKKVDMLEISEIRAGSEILNDIKQQGVVIFERLG